MAKAGTSASAFTSISDSQPQTVPKSQSEIDSDSSAGSADSEQDIEHVTPKRREGLVAGANIRGSIIAQGKSLPKYAPPRGMTSTSVDATFKDSSFEYDRLASNSRLQLWAIRVPADFKPSRLSSLKFTPPSASRQVSGSLRHKASTYRLAPAGRPHMLPAVVDEQGRQPLSGPAAADSMALSDPVMLEEGGDEMGHSMKLLVPSVKQNGALIAAPLKITQHLLLTPELPQPSSAELEDQLPSYLSETIPTSSSAPSTTGSAAVSKRSQPSHLFKFRNRAFGFDTPGPAVTRIERIDMDRKQPEAIAGPESPVKDKKNSRKSEGGEATQKKRRIKA